MGYYVGLDVSLKTTHICVLDADRRVVWQGVSDTHVEMISAKLKRWQVDIVRVGLETGSLTPWLYHGLVGQGLPVVCMDARQVLISDGSGFAPALPMPRAEDEAQASSNEGAALLAI